MSALLALAFDVVLLAARRRTLWLCGIASTLLVAALTLPLDVQVERRAPLPRADEVGGPRSLSVSGRMVPGSIHLEAAPAPGGQAGWTIVDDASGRLVVRSSGAPRGHVDYSSPGELVLDPDVAPVGTSLPAPGSGGVELRVAWRESLTTARDRAALLAEAAGTGLYYAGFEVTHDTEQTTRIGGREAARQHLIVFLWFALIFIMAASVGVAVGVFLTADAVSSALEPGSAEVLLSRPLSRPTVVLGRFLGALLFGGLQALWLVGLAVAVGGLKLGLWVPELLLCVGPLLLKLALLVAIATFVGNLLRVQALGLVAAALAWALSFVVNMLWESAHTVAAAGGAGAPAEGLGRFLPELAWARQLLPQVSHIDTVAGLFLGVDAELPDFRPWAIVGQDAVWILGCLALTCLVVSRREY